MVVAIIMGIALAFVLSFILIGLCVWLDRNCTCPHYKFRALRAEVEVLQEVRDIAARWVTQPDSLLHKARCEHGIIIYALLRSAGGWWK